MSESETKISSINLREVLLLKNDKDVICRKYKENIIIGKLI